MRADAPEFTPSWLLSVKVVDSTNGSFVKDNFSNGVSHSSNGKVSTTRERNRSKAARHNSTVSYRKNSGSKPVEGSNIEVSDLNMKRNIQATTRLMRTKADKCSIECKQRAREYRKHTAKSDKKDNRYLRNHDFPPLGGKKQVPVDSTPHTITHVGSQPCWSSVIHKAHIKSKAELVRQQNLQQVHAEGEIDALHTLRLKKQLYEENVSFRPCEDSARESTVESAPIPSEGGKEGSLCVNLVRVDTDKLKQRWIKIWNLSTHQELKNTSTSKQSSLEDVDWNVSSDSKSLSSSFDDDASSVASSNSHSSDHCNIPASKYLCQSFPIHATILDDNVVALRYLLCLPASATRYDDLVSLVDLSKDLSYHPLSLKGDEKNTKMRPIHLSILLDKFQMVQAILEHESSDGEKRSVNALDERHRTPLVLASCLGLEPHITILLAHGAKLNIKDAYGNTALHNCCQTGFLSALQSILLLGNNKNATQRLMCSRNGQGQTPFHVACAAGSTAIIEKLLSISVATSMKAMQLCDNFGRTPLLVAIEAGMVPVVELLILWRRNQQRLSKQKAICDTESPSICPLVLAIQNGNLEMLRVLLEVVGDLLNSRYASKTLNNALLFVAENEWCVARCDMAVLLIEAGADPFASFNSFEHDNLVGFTFSKSVVTLLARRGDISLLKTALDAFLVVSKEARVCRRRDIFSRDRPPSFFYSLEEKEDDIVKTALQEALIASLFTCWEDSSDDKPFPSKHLLTSAFLLKKGASLDELGFARLASGFVKERGKRFIPFVVGTCRASYIHLTPGKPSGVKHSYFESHTESFMGYWSSVLSSIPWVWAYNDSLICCGWWLEKVQAVSGTSEIVDSSDVCYLLVGQDRLLAHKSILSSKSKKLAAAFRFSSLKQSDGHKCDEVQLDISIRMLVFFMQHCYHGSIFFGLSTDINVCCRELMELSLIADEYICPSLLAECEMRLISSKPHVCFCWCCCTTVESIAEREADAFALSSNSIECEFSVCTPSKLITARTAFSILLLSHQLAPCHSGYEIKVDGVGPTTFRVGYPVCQPFVVAKLIALKAILLEFRACQEGESYLDYCHQLQSDGETIYAQEEFKTLALLKNCLDEISCCLVVKESVI